MRKTAVILVIGLVAGFTYYWLKRPAAPADTATGSPSTPVAGGRLTVTYRSEPKTFNRLVSPQLAEELVSRLTQATLLRMNRATGELGPGLAREWTSSPDGLTWTLKLQDGVTYSDGTPFTSADVVFTFQALFDPKVKSAMASSLMIEGKPLQVRALDASTVVVVLPAPYGPGLSMLDSVPILPRHKLAAALEAGTFAEAWGTTTPPADVVGLGPFVIQEYVPGQRLVFARNTKFWRKDEAGRTLPYLDAIELQFVADQNAEVVRLQAGQTDMMSKEVRFEDLAALQDLQKKGKVLLYEAGTTIAPDMLWLNLDPSAAVAKTRPWLQREELRHAISAAVDRRAVVNTIFLGEATELAGPITAGHKGWFLPDLKPPSGGAEKAKELLASIGLKDRNGDGLVDDAQGKTAKFALLTQKGHTVRERSAALVKEQMRKVGLEIDVVPLEPRFMIEAWSKGEYDAIYYAIESDSLDPARNPEFWLSSGSFHFWNPGQKTPSTTWEGKIDELTRKHSASMNADERRRLFAEAQRVFAEHEPVIYFAAPKVILATSARVHGATPSVFAPHLLWNAERLFIK
ncbi:MAG TPA: ABC transporter substrate-binding protein [Vicinamibacterales bacterium]|nr:ABC transporter substrate-binding protein [Vicinamibacterales bacterium]